MTGPARLWIVRHAQSTGNVARDEAMQRGLDIIDIKERDIDVPLSPLGETQAAVLGTWLSQLAPGERPELVWSSPFRRARRTAELACGPAGLPLVQDERLREKEFGLLDRLTKSGIELRHPDQARLRGSIGKFYYRPPSGESWCDVVLRLRSFLSDLRMGGAGKRVLIVAHQVVVLCLRYILEDLDEERLLAIDAAGDVGNCAVTEYQGEGADFRMRLLRYNFVPPPVSEIAGRTSEPPAGAAP